MKGIEQRHQPHLLKPTTYEKISELVNLMKEMVHCTINLSDVSIDDNLYCILVAIPGHSDGVHGAGGLTGQHIIHVAAFLGLLPRDLLSLATISTTTNTFKHLMEFGYTYENAGDETRTLLDAVLSKMEVSKPEVENIVCKWISSIKEKGKHWVNSVFPRQSIYYYSADDDRISFITPQDPTEMQTFCQNWK